MFMNASQIKEYFEQRKKEEKKLAKAMQISEEDKIMQAIQDREATFDVNKMIGFGGMY